MTCLIHPRPFYLQIHPTWLHLYLIAGGNSAFDLPFRPYCFPFADCSQSLFCPSPNAMSQQ